MLESLPCVKKDSSHSKMFSVGLVFTMTSLTTSMGLRAKTRYSIERLVVHCKCMFSFHNVIDLCLLLIQTDTHHYDRKECEQMTTIYYASVIEQYGGHASRPSIMLLVLIITPSE